MKKVSFYESNNKTYILYVWLYAHRQARKSDWMSYALDRDRFNRRIKNFEMLSKFILNENHRNRIYLSRFKDSTIE